MPAPVKEVQVKQLKELKQQVRELQMRYKTLEIELFRREWSHRACLKEKDALIRKYKQQLSVAAEQERILEQSKMQAELDWQQLCENGESDRYQKSEDLTQSLSSAREQAEVDQQKTNCVLHEVKTHLSVLPVEREQTAQESFNHSLLPEGEKQKNESEECAAVRPTGQLQMLNSEQLGLGYQTLLVFQHGDKSSLSKDIPTLEIKKLQEQNANLRAAIAQMRKEMESLDEQVVSSLPVTGNKQHAEQDSLCTNKVPAGTALSNIKASSANLDSVANPDTEKGPKPKVHEEKMVDLGQQLPDVGPGVGVQYDVSCALQGMQNKLKGAARKISVLSQEKQQLLEMGNRLRAELGMVLKEGLWHPVSSKHCTVCLASGTLFPRELLQRIQCQLLALKHLQHRLATQVQLDLALENYGPEPRKADTSSKVVQSQPLRQSPCQAQQVQLSSSRAHNFCQGAWQTLERESSSSVLRLRKNTDQVDFEVICSTEQAEESQQNIKANNELEMLAADLAVRGTRLEVQQKLKSRNLSCALPIKPKISSNRAKIRNYNIKD